MSIHNFLDQIQHTPGCHLFAQAGLPVIASAHVLPQDVQDFYERCGGLSLFEEAPFPLSIVSPREVVLVNPIIVGELADYDISSTWYVIARDENGEYLTIDLSKERNGRCYNSFSDRHRVAGSCP